MTPGAAVVTVAVVAVVLLCVGVRCQPPTPCCMAKTFTAVMSDLKKINANLIRNSFITVDFDAMKEALIDTDYDPVTKKSVEIGKTIFDFKKKMSFFLPGNQPTQCQRKPWNFEMFHNCIPDEALYLGSSYLGLPNTFLYDGWRYPYPGTGTNTSITIAISPEGCVPIVQGLVGEMDEHVDFLWFYNHYVPDNIDPRVFDLPESCNN